MNLVAHITLKKPIDPIVLTELVERALWLPHLVQTHIRGPHYSTDPIMPSLTGTISSMPGPTSV